MRWRGITEGEIEAKIAELRTKVEQDYKEHQDETADIFQKLQEIMEGVSSI